MDAPKIGNLLMKKREQIGMSQEDLAEKLMVPKHKIETWETGKTHLPVVHYEKICDLLHISIAELLTGEEISPEKKQEETEKQLWTMTKYIRDRQGLWTISILLMVCGGFIMAILPNVWELSIGQENILRFLGLVIFCSSILLEYHVKHLP